MPELSVSSVAVEEWFEPVVESDPEFARAEAGQARPSGEDMAWVLADLAPVLAGADVLTLRAESEPVWASEFGWAVRGVEVDLHFVDVADAARVASVFGLVGVDELRKSGWVWRSWSGWDADASRCGFPVGLRFTARVARAGGLAEAVSS